LKSLLLKLVVTSILLPTVVWANCNDHSVTLQILGSGGPEIDDQRASSSYLVWADNKAVALIDMGEGASLNYELSGAKFNDLDVVAFSHFHADHSADFPVLVKGSYFSTADRHGSGDMNSKFHSLANLATNTDILVAHNAVPEQAAARNLHIPPSEIGLIAKKAAVHK
jgi:ribonuclease BN (tRNA processing enzyme)